MAETPQPLDTRTLEEQFESCTKAAARFLAVLVAVSLTAMYLCANALGWLQPFERGFSTAGRDVRARLEADILELEPLLAFSDQLLRHPEVVRGYREFIRPFEALDNAASVAISSSARSGDAFGSIDPLDLEKARDNTTGLSQLSIDLDFYSGDDLRSSGLGVFEHFIRAFVHPERTLDNRALRQQLEADARVARALGQSPPIPSSLPRSFHFRDYLDSLNEPEILKGLDSAGRIPNPDSIVARLIEVGAQNKASMSVAGLQNLLRREEFVFTKDSSAVEKVQVSFLPIGINRNLLVLFSPIALVLVLTLLASQLDRKRRLQEALLERVELRSMELLESQWLVSRFSRSHERRSWEDLSRNVLIAFTVLGYLVPVIADLMVVRFLARLRLPMGIAIPFWLAVLASTLVTFGIVAGTIRLQSFELRVRATGGRRESKRVGDNARSRSTR